MVEQDRVAGPERDAAVRRSVTLRDHQDACVQAPPVRWRLEAPFVVSVLAVAAFLRFYDLTAFPSGLHGDEAITGLEGQRILSEGWIGVYSPLALGQPTGPLYLNAIAVWFLGETVFAVRIVPALLSIVTVLVLYLLVREHLGPSVAAISAALLATMGWHVHYGRIGFPLSAWPLVALVAVWALIRAMRTGEVRWWAVAGASAGAGIYVYNAHTLFLGILGLFVVRQLFGWLAAGVAAAVVSAVVFPHPATLFVLGVGSIWLLLRHQGITRRSLARFAAFGMSLGIVLLPMARFAADPANGYFNHARGVSVFAGAEWNERQGVVEQGAFLAERYAQYWTRLCCRPDVDGVDATGIVPIVPLTMLALAAIGLPFWRQSRHLFALGLVVVVAMPWASVVTFDGLARRTFVIAPFLAVFAAVGIASLLALVRHRRATLRMVVGVTVLGLVSIATFQNIANEFRDVRGTPEERWIFGHEITEAARYLRTLPDDHHVYFFADRWSVEYETRRFLAPDVSVEDRSREFGELAVGVDAELGRPVFVFLGKYRYLADRIEAFYPGGEMVIGSMVEGNEPTFIAYLPRDDGPYPYLPIRDHRPGMYGPAP